MKLAFSEYRSDYARYTYSYVVWAFPEAGETPADFFERGFLPGVPDLSRYYLCRNLRVCLPRFAPSSENRRILRQGEGVSLALVPRAEFDYTAARRSAWKAYADRRFGEETMGFERLDRLMRSPVASHLLVFHDPASARELGTVLLYLEPPRVAFYYYAFYELEAGPRNLGLFMMTSAVRHFAGLGYAALHLGTCYSERALYKTQFAGLQFCNGLGWSEDLEELKFLVRRETAPVEDHLFATPEYWEKFAPAGPTGLGGRSHFRLGSAGAGSAP